MRTGLVMGVDIGTNGCRAVLYDETARIWGRSERFYGIKQPRKGWMEQDPEEIYSAFLAVIRNCISSLEEGSKDIGGPEPRTSGSEISGPYCPERKPFSIKAVGISSVLHSLMAVDGAGRPLTPLLIWGDTRSQAYADEIKRSLDEHTIYRRTGCRVHPMYAPSKIAWIKGELSQVFQEAKKFISIKEYILFRLFGEFVVDTSVASGSGLLNIGEQSWDDGLLSLLGLKEDRLSELVSPYQVVGRVGQQLSQRTGLPEGTAVVAGAGDGMLSNLGNGSIGEGEMTLTLGTSGAERLAVKEPSVDSRGRTWCYVLDENIWMVGGAINNGGIVYQWCKENLYGKEIEDQEIQKEIEEVRPGCQGLLFLPYLCGERSPGWRSQAKGTLVGLTLNHGKADILRAALEGVGFKLYSIYLAIQDVAGEVREIKASGGFLNSDLWPQIISDILGRELEVTNIRDAATYGAAIVAQKSLGMIRELAEVKSNVRVVRTFVPNPENHRIYKQLYQIFQDTYSRMPEIWEDLDRF